MLTSRTLRCWVIATSLVALVPSAACADDWPRWRGPDGLAVAPQGRLPTSWTSKDNVRWKWQFPGEGSSSPIVTGQRVLLTSAWDEGTNRGLHCLEFATGELLWSRSVDDTWPELTSAVTGHAAATPVTDGKLVVCAFGNAGVVCYDLEGELIWHRKFGIFESELGLATSPILFGSLVILVCDHDGKRPRSFDSFVIALDLKTGDTRWKTDRRRLFRSWSTPILVSGPERTELVINAQDELRGYDAATGTQLWHVSGMTGWVTPSPVFGDGLIFATSGRNGPAMAVKPGGDGDVTDSHVAWQHPRGAPYVCSPLLYRGLLYVHNEQGILTCYEAATGQQRYRQRLGGKFTASGVAGDGKIYLTNEAGITFVIRAGPQYKLLAQNDLAGYSVASAAIAHGHLLLRTRRWLYCVTPD